MTKTKTKTKTKTPRPLYIIAEEIYCSWPKVNYAAVPYLEAMSFLSSIGGAVGADEGRTIVMYFLANASSYRGETARRIKVELKSMLK